MESLARGPGSEIASSAVPQWPPRDDGAPGRVGRRWSGPGAGDGALSAGRGFAAGRRTPGAGPWRRSRRSPSATFRAPRRLRSAHDFSAARRRRARRRRSFGRTLRSRETRIRRSLNRPLPGTAGHHYQAPRSRLSGPRLRVPRDDGPGFLPIVTDVVRGPTRNDGGLFTPPGQSARAACGSRPRGG